jgi:hypothetical protein
MHDTTPPGRPNYPDSVERVDARRHRHAWFVDGALAAVLLAGSANAYLGRPAVLPASLVLAGTVAVRRRFPIGAYVTALAVGAAQVAVGIGTRFTDSPLQPTFADAGILILLYTLATERTRRVSLPGLAACVVLFAAAAARYNPGADRSHHLVIFFLGTGLFYLLTPVSAWVLGDSMGYRRAYSAALEERAVRAERERDAQAQIAAAAEPTPPTEGDPEWERSLSARTSRSMASSRTPPVKRASGTAAGSSRPGATTVRDFTRPRWTRRWAPRPCCRAGGHMSSWPHGGRLAVASWRTG